VVAASLSVTRAGAREGMLSAAELDEKLIEVGIMPPPPPTPAGEADADAPVSENGPAA